MKKLFCLVAPLMVFGLTASIPASAQVVISQVYGGGGNSGATYNSDFVELYNGGSSTVTMSGWQVAYASASGTSWTNRTIFSGSIAAHGYFLIQESTGSTGVALPTRTWRTAQSIFPAPRERLPC